MCYQSHSQRSACSVSSRFALPLPQCYDLLRRTADLPAHGTFAFMQKHIIHTEHMAQMTELPRRAGFSDEQIATALSAVAGSGLPPSGPGSGQLTDLASGFTVVDSAGNAAFPDNPFAEMGMSAQDYMSLLNGFMGSPSMGMPASGEERKRGRESGAEGEDVDREGRETKRERFMEIMD